MYFKQGDCVKQFTVLPAFKLLLNRGSYQESPPRLKRGSSVSEGNEVEGAEGPEAQAAKAHVTAPEPRPVADLAFLPQPPPQKNRQSQQTGSLASITHHKHAL